MQDSNCISGRTAGKTCDIFIKQLSLSFSKRKGLAKYGILWYESISFVCDVLVVVVI